MKITGSLVYLNNECLIGDSPSLVCQRNIRGWLVRKSFSTSAMLRGVVLLQKRVRGVILRLHIKVCWDMSIAYIE